MEEGEPGHALKKRDDLGTRIEPILPRAPRLQRGAGNIETVSGLTLGEPSGLQVVILLKECSASASRPSLVTSPLPRGCVSMTVLTAPSSPRHGYA